MLPFQYLEGAMLLLYFCRVTFSPTQTLVIERHIDYAHSHVPCAHTYGVIMPGNGVDMAMFTDVIDTQHQVQCNLNWGGGGVFVNAKTGCPSSMIRWCHVPSESLMKHWYFKLMTFF